MNTLKSELRFLSKKYIAFLIHKGWTKLRAQAAAERLAASYAEINQKEDLIKNSLLKNEELCEKIEDMKSDMTKLGTQL